MIISLEQSIIINKNLHENKKRIILVGGCFDIVHLGHIIFLQKAKEQGDILMVLLESDKKIAEMKGTDRPYNTQNERAVVLTELRSVDYVVVLPYISEDKQYDDLVKQIKPAIIATTKHDPGLAHKIRQAESIQVKVVEVVDAITGHSTSIKAQKLYKNDEL